MKTKKMMGLVLTIVGLVGMVGVCHAQEAEKSGERTVVARVPAYGGVIEREQPNGKIVRVKLIGDEAWHAMFTEDGWQVLEGKKGWIYYAVATGEMYTDRRGQQHPIYKCSRKKAKNADERSKCEKRWLEKKGVARGN